MKKALVLLFVGVLILGLAACSQSPTGSTVSSAEEEREAAVAGGWTPTGSPVVPDEVRVLLEKATEGLAGAEYTPVAYLASQVVAGANHRLLCTVEPVTPDSVATYALVTIYEDLQGNAEILEVRGSEAEAGVPGLAGGWQTPETPEVTEEAAAALEKASGELAGAEYAPVALLGTQVVAGLNYSILCQVTPVVQPPQPDYAVVIVYQDLDGGAQITDTFDFQAAE